MKVYYSIDIQMFGTYEIEDAVMELASRDLGFGKNDIEEAETHSASVLFVSSVPPREMRDRVRKLLTASNAIHYVDVMYRFEYAMVPDRFVIWRDGREQDYTGYITFREDN